MKSFHIKKIAGAALFVAFCAVAYYAVSPLFRNSTLDEPLPAQKDMVDLERQIAEMNKVPEKPMREVMPESGSVSPAFPIQGTIGHPASGRALVLESDKGTVIRFEDLDTINGPNLHVYLAKDLSAKEFVDLGPLKATNGNINYLVPEGVDIGDYPYVMHWCVPFGVLFNYAHLTQ